MSRALVVLFAMISFLSTAGAQESALPGEDPYARWAVELGDPAWEVREEATAKLLAAGPAALPAVVSAAGSSDLERAERARTILPLVRWGISPELVSKVGGGIESYDAADGTRRHELVKEAARSGGETALPFLRAVERYEIRQGVRIEAEDAIAEIYLGLARLASGEAARELSREEVERHARGILEAPVASPGGRLQLAWVSALLNHVRGRACALQGCRSLALEMVRAGLDAAGGSPSYRMEAAARLLAHGLREPALALLAPEIEGASGANAPGVVALLLDQGESDLGLEVALAALATSSGEETVARGLLDAFLVAGEFERARHLAGLLPGGGREELRIVARAAFDAESGVALARGEFERTGDLGPLVEEMLFHGLGAEALELVLAHEASLGHREDYRNLAFRAAVAALDFDTAARFGGRPSAWRGSFEDAGLARARFAWALASGRRLDVLVAAAVLSAGTEDLLRALAATRLEAIFDVREGREAGSSAAFESAFRAGRVAELEGRRARALLEYASVLVPLGFESDPRWLRLRRELGARCEVLAKDPEALALALSLACDAGPASERARLRAEIHRHAGYPLPAASEFSRSLEYRGGNLSPAERLELAAFLLRAADAPRAVTALAPVVALGSGDGWGRAALPLFARVERERGRESRTTALPPQGQVLDPQVHVVAATFLERVGEYDAAEVEWGWLAGRRTEFQPDALEHLAELAAARGDFSRAADLLSRSFGLRMVRPDGGRDPSEDPSRRARIEFWRAEAALAAGCTEEALRRLRRALSHDPFLVEAAESLAELARASDPELAGRADRVAISELHRRVARSPHDPHLHARLASALAAAGQAGEAIPWAARAASLHGGEAYRGLAELLRNR
ncbi:MAG: hypothetical protein HY720_06365 [Planctomycetes bacterium]|nr:hypothetical protein [Planctomycetota bacterium]